MLLLVVILIMLLSSIIGFILLKNGFVFSTSTNTLIDDDILISKSHGEILKKVRQVEIRTKNISNQLFSGTYHSAFKGRGMSFSEVREYQVGDDVRSIDWNVTARFNNPYVKVFEEERELNVMLLIDVSASSFFGSSEKSKIELITEIAATIAFSAIRNNDKVGVLFFSDKIEKFIPLKKGKSHVLLIIRELLNIKVSSAGTDIGKALDFFNHICKKRSIAFLISDFISDDYKKSLQQAKKKHDIIGLHIYDALEEKLPDLNAIEMKDSETGQSLWIDTSNLAQQKVYAQIFQKRNEVNKQLFLKNGIEFQSINTAQSYMQLLIQLFKNRKNKK